MPAIPPEYQFTATNAQEVQTLLRAAGQLVDAHLAMLCPGESVISSALRKATPAHMSLTLDLGPLIQRITEVAELNEQLNTPSDNPNN
ncbi:hypothetical protein ACFYPA_06245 [Streptomyces sp. NPDC005775]|uniref:hypothetical protein n=1 Tax=Streptomyces sp. NPDC005775 TaxID=3364729 RepID=UPI003680F779